MEKAGCVGVVAYAAAMATLLLQPLAAAAPPAAAAGPGSSCTRSCGNITIPYPFGMEPGCYHAAGFNLTCRNSSPGNGPPELFLGDGTIQVLDISVEHSTVRINSAVVQARHHDHVRVLNRTWGSRLPKGGPYFVSVSENRLLVLGCNTQITILGEASSSLVSSCTAFCPLTKSKDAYDAVYMGNGSCTGISCCQASIILGYSSYKIQIHKLDDIYSPLFVYIVDQSFNDTIDAVDRLFDRKPSPQALPATLDWIVSNSTCPTNTPAPECRSTHSYCKNSLPLGHGGYICKCSDGYQGNPYILGGCRDIDECESPETYGCYGDCTNIPGSFVCRCPSGYTGNASTLNGCRDIDECEHPEANSCFGSCQNSNGSFHCQCPSGTYGDPFVKRGCIKMKNSFTGFSIGLGVGGGTTLLLLAFSGPLIMHKIKLQGMKKKFFKQNHGLLLQQLISQNANISERMIITLRELELATNNFDRECVVGGGGHGVIYKGILDLRVVAIKKAKIEVQREIDEFINEVVILSQVNHRNVVKFLGCCLETEVPLLVYEFISNGTVYHHLHVEGSVSLSWDDRLRIALEVARALSYLHSATSIPIFHRDIKSSNILLDDSLTAKVSDFGASRYIPIDQTGVTTAVQGTIGYLDPMYYSTGRLTDKSDVFSFGVILVELLTKKKPFVHRPEYNGGLVSHFISLYAEGNLGDIMDPQVMEEGNGEVQEVAALAATCTKMKGEDRPTMRQVEMTLENLLAKRKQVPCLRTPRRHDDDRTVAQYMSIERVSEEASRQHTMEEEMLLSSRYPR